MPTSCPKKQSIYHKKWYLKNRDFCILRASKRKEQNILWYKEYKKTLKCSKCGENHPQCIEFHHKNSEEKERNIAELANAGWGKERIIKEIEKCDVLCANCHRKLHWPLV